jgi:hypothetical protein
MSTALADLLGLWRGDEDCAGYIHEGLAREIARRMRPADFDVFLKNLYPDGDPSDDGKDVAIKAWSWWVIERERDAKKAFRKSINRKDST